MPRRVVVRKQDQTTLMSEFHESPWAGHRGTWAMFEKLKEKYWWPSMYKDVLGNMSLRMEDAENRLNFEPAPIGSTDCCGHLCKYAEKSYMYKYDLGHIL